MTVESDDRCGVPCRVHHLIPQLPVWIMYPAGEVWMIPEIAECHSAKRRSLRFVVRFDLFQPSSRPCEVIHHHP